MEYVDRIARHRKVMMSKADDLVPAFASHIVTRIVSTGRETFKMINVLESCYALISPKIVSL